MAFAGCESAEKNNMTRHMKKGDRVAIIPGGYQEATVFEYGKHILYQRNRGWVKYALQYGYTVVPIYSFGDELSFYNFKWFKDFRLWVNSFKILLVFFISKFGFLPDPNCEITTIYGKKIPFPTIKEPTSEQVEYYHNLYL